MKCDSVVDCYCGFKIQYASMANIEGYYLYTCESCGRFHRIFRSADKNINCSCMPIIKNEKTKNHL